MKHLITTMKYDLYKKRLVYKGKRGKKSKENGKMPFPIDFVVTWVDGGDPEWLEKKEFYARKEGLVDNNKDNGEERFREWDIFRYWFRAVEKYAPWVRNIYFITCGQIPIWMNVHSSKIKVINHTDFIPKQYLPTFNSRTIELNLHRIENLSEYFVYFNDDMFLNRVVYPTDFFREGKPNLTAIARPLKNITNSAFEHAQFSNLSIVNNKFRGEISRRIEIHPEKWFSSEYGKYDTDCNLYAFDQNYLPGMVFPHLGVAFRKSTIKKVWEENEKILNETSMCRFRKPQNIMHQIFSIYDMLEGNFNPVGRSHHGKVFSAQIENLEEMEETIVNEKYRMICINDSEILSHEDFLVVKKRIKKAFEKVLPQKSEFEN